MGRRTQGALGLEGGEEAAKELGRKALGRGGEGGRYRGAGGTIFNLTN